MFRYAPILAALLAAALTPAWAAPPTQLLGKSVTVTWSETRVQRNVGEAKFRTVNAAHELRVYVSSAGRVFNKLVNTTRSGTGSSEQVAGQSGATRVPSFSGQTMTVIQPQARGMARRIAANFDSGFANCTADVQRGKEPGTKVGLAHSLITGKMIEVQSTTIGGTSCTIRAGNVFGN